MKKAFRTELDKMIPHLESFFHKLSPREEQILRTKYGIGAKQRSLGALAKQWGITRERVSSERDHALMHLLVKVAEQALRAPA